MYISFKLLVYYSFYNKPKLYVRTKDVVKDVYISFDENNLRIFPQQKYHFIKSLPERNMPFHDITTS